MGNPPRVLLAFPDTQSSKELKTALVQIGLDPITTSSAEEALEQVKADEPAVVFCSSELPGSSFREFFRALRMVNRDVPVVVASRLGDWDEYLEAMGLGAFDCIAPPFERRSVEWVARNALNEYAGHVPVKKAPASVLPQRARKAAG